MLVLPALLAIVYLDGLHLVQNGAGELVRRRLATHIAGTDLTVGLLVLDMETCVYQCECE